jgi:hypothetical protein
MQINLAGLKEIGRRNATGTMIITFIAEGDNPRAAHDLAGDAPSATLLSLLIDLILQIRALL